MFESKYLNAVLEPFYYTLSFLKIKVRFFCLFLIFMAPFIKVFSQKYLLFDETKIPKENLALLINKTDVGIIKIDNKELNKICPVRMYLLPGEYTIVVFKILMDKPYLINGNSFATTIILNIKVEKGHKYKIDYKSDSKKPLIEYLYIITIIRLII